MQTNNLISPGDMKRVVHFVSSLNTAGGVGSLLLRLTKLARNQGLDFDFVSLNPDLDRFCYHEFEKLGCGVKHISPPSQGGILNFRKKVKTFLLENGPYDVVHSHMLHLNGIVLQVAHCAGVKKRVSHSHNASYEATRDRNTVHSCYNSILTNMNSLYATDRLACSKIAGRFLYQKGLLFPKEFTVFKNAIDVLQYQGLSLTEKNKLRVELGIEKSDVVIGCVARLVKIKNHRYLLKVFKELISKLPNAKLLLVGDGKEAEEIKSVVKKYELSEQVIFTGIRNDVPHLMQIMDVFVLTSEAEGLGIVVVEAQAAGVSCVVSSAIPDDADLGCGLIKRLDLNMGAKSWAKAITKATKKQKKDARFIQECAFDNGYDLNRAIIELKLVYGG